MIRRVAALAAAAIVLAGCGDDGGRFDDQVAQVREAVESGDRQTALEALDAIALLGVDGRTTGELSEAEAVELQALVDQGRALVDQQLPEEGPTAEAAPAPQPEPSSGEERGDEDEEDEGDEKDDDGGKGEGKGNGRGKGND